MNAGLVADIGGTNARFAQVGAGALGARLDLPCADFGSFPELLAAVTESGLLGAPPGPAVLAVAGPVDGDRCVLTNRPPAHDWSLDALTAARLLGVPRVHLANDLVAVARALPLLPPTDLVLLGGDAAAGTAVVLAPGTGLGVAALVTDAGGGWLALPSEAGHAGFAPADALERELVGLLQIDTPTLSVEQVISGPGLLRLYRAMAALWGVAPTAESAEAVVAGAHSAQDPVCDQTLRTFVNMLADVSGNLAVTWLARGGVYLTGSLVQSLRAELAAPAFRHRFAERGQMSALCASIPTWVITATEPGLVGAAGILATLGP